MIYHRRWLGRRFALSRCWMPYVAWGRGQFEIGVHRISGGVARFRFIRIEVQ